MRTNEYRISYDDGIKSGSCNPGWLLLDENGDWQPMPAEYDVDAGTWDDVVAAEIVRRHPGATVILCGTGWERVLAGEEVSA